MPSLASSCLLLTLFASCCASEPARAKPTEALTPEAIVSRAPETPGHVESPITQGDEPATVETFVRQIYIHGLPYEDASRYDASVVPTLLKLLQDPKEEPYWSNVVQMLGIVGDEDVADTILTFIQEDAGAAKLTREQYAAKSSGALTALGYLVHRTGSERAVEYLLEGLVPETWQKRVEWTSPYQAASGDRNRQLTQLCVMALALTGHPRAGEALRSLKSAGTRPEISGLLDEAVATHELVRKEGLKNYYKGRKN